MIMIDRESQRVWNFDPAYTTVEFSIRNLWFKVKGRFRDLEGAIVLDEDDVSSDVDDVAQQAEAHAPGGPVTRIDGRGALVGVLLFVVQGPIAAGDSGAASYLRSASVSRVRISMDW